MCLIQFKLLCCQIGNKPVFRKVENKNCEFNENDSKIENLVDAMTSCHLDSHCMAVFDQYCKGNDFHLCKHGSITPSKLGNCVYSIGIDIN